MATNPSQRTPLAYHLTDQALSPILSSSTGTPSAASQFEIRGLAGLSKSALTAYDSASRLGLGTPQRIMVETRNGPLVLHSYLNSQSQQPSTGRSLVEQARDEHRPLSRNTETPSEDRGEGRLTVNGTSAEGREEDKVERGPMLVATVVTPTTHDAGEARRMAARLERVGRGVQREWIAEQAHAQIEGGEGGGEHGEG